MPDTQRTLTDLLINIFQDDQLEGSITPQDVRDLIVSIGQVPFGGIHITDPGIETSIPDVDTYVKIAGTSELVASRNMDMPENGRFRHIGLIPYHFRIAVSASMFSAGTNKLYGFQIFVFDDSAGSGALAVPSQINRRFGSTGDEGSVSLHWDVILATNDYVETWVANLDDATNITVEHLYLSAIGHLV